VPKEGRGGNPVLLSTMKAGRNPGTVCWKGRSLSIFVVRYRAKKKRQKEKKRKEKKNQFGGWCTEDEKDKNR
jgi:hypothetical protein